MDMIYLEKPVLLLLPVLLLFWQILSHFLIPKLSAIRFAESVCTGIGILAHAVSITILLFAGSSLQDVLILVLLSGTVTLALCPKPETGTDKEDKAE